MKVELKEQEKLAFQPIVLTITLENRDDLIDLFNRTRITNDDLYRILKEGSYIDVDFPENQITNQSFNVFQLLIQRLRGK